MSNREFAKTLIDRIPESKLVYIISYLQGAAVPDETPNVETLEAFTELDNCDIPAPIRAEKEINQ